MAKRLGADVVTLGYMNTAFSFVLMCGGPLYGRFGDVFGSRMALMLSCSAAVLAYGILSLANSVPMLFLSRIPMGFMHTFQGLQMVITDISDKTGRAEALGKLGLAFSLGIMAGPMTGGVVAEKFGDRMVAFTASALSISSVIMVQLFLPKNTKSKIKKETAVSDSEHLNKSGMSRTLEMLSKPKVMYPLVLRMAAMLPTILLQSMGSVIAMEYFKLGPRENGLLLAAIGLASAIVQGFGIGMLSRRFSDQSLLLLSFSISGCAFSMMCFATHTFLYVVSQVTMVIGFSLMRTITTSMATKAVNAHDTGLLLGLNATSEAFMRTVTPAIGTFMFLNYGWQSFGTLGTTIDFGVVVILLVKGLN
ncbi:solute carrier family 22 member 18-like isoform X2 [Orbicella faveolata]|nr:solute carrier family 22 member 18-like isoform X2 [Orbicella faveolata]